MQSSVWEKWAKEHFWPKTTKFWPKTAKKLKTIIFAPIFFSPFFKRPKNEFLWQKSEKFKVAFGRNRPKIRNVTNLSLWMPNFMQETRKKYSTVLAAEPERTHARTHGSEFIGSFRKLKLPGNQLK